MGYAATNNLTFKGLLSYYKTYGQLTNPNQGAGFNTFDWIVNEFPNPSGELRVKEAYWLYFGNDLFGVDIPWTASVGRRPATDGLLVNFRDDQNAKSPIGHIINTEFDGASFKFDLSNATNISGIYFKICLGRGMTNASVWNSGIQPGIFYGSTSQLVLTGNGTDFNKVDGSKNTDLGGFIFVPYDDGQYSVHTTAFKAFNLPGIVINDALDLDGDGRQETPIGNFEQVGELYGAAVSFLAQGIGDGMSDMLDETNAFVSFAWSKTDPKSNTQMLGMYIDGDGDGIPETLLGADFGESKTGTSIYAGLNWPCQLIDDARVGVEYNHGSKYWRSFTYGEDTLAGSKLATRGDAYEIWFNKELVGENANSSNKIYLYGL